MPVTLTIDVEKRLVYSAFLGDVTEEEFVCHSQTIRSHPNFDPTFSEIIDFRSVTDAQISTDRLQAMAGAKSIFSSEAQHVVIAPSGLITGLARMFQVLAEQTRPNLGVVKTPAQAYEYLRDHLGEKN
ncbi:MAG TPA: hypothetical protein VJX16_22520 [Terriglobales bacterium]|nr:hypothetical protein [Terriglobales bacterium]